MAAPLELLVHLAVADDAARAVWRACLASRGLREVGVAGEAGLVVCDAAGLEPFARLGPRPWIIALAEAGQDAAALLALGASDVCFEAEERRVSARLEVALRALRGDTARSARQLQNMLSLLRGMSEAALRIRDRGELLETACRLAHAHGFLGAWMSLLGPDRRTMRVVAHAGQLPPEPQSMEPVVALLGGVRPRTRDVVAAATRETPDVIALPLREAKRVVGALVLLPAPGTLGSEVGPFLEDLATNLSLALEVIDEEERRRQTVAMLRARERREAAAAHVGRRALEIGDPEVFMSELAPIVADALGAELCRILRHEPERGELTVCASQGYGGQAVGEREPLQGSPAGFALGHSEAVVVEDFAQEDRFVRTPALAAAGAMAGLLVVVPGRTRRWGLIEVARVRPERFTDDDVHFAQIAAADLGHLIELDNAARDLRRSEQTFRTLIEAAPDAVLVCSGGRFVYANDAARKLFAHDAAAFERLTPEALYPDDAAQVRARIERAEQTGEVNPLVMLRARRADGSPLLVESVSLRLPIDGRWGVMELVRDVTERQAMREKLMTAERLSAVGTLAAGVAHEINNPLAYVIGNLSFLNRELEALRAELATRGPAPEPLTSMQEALGEAQEGAQRVRQIVSDLKTFSRADEELRGPVDVNAVLESSINIAMSEIRQKARLVRELGPVPRVQASSGRLGQVFLNLLINAAQAIPEGRPEMVVRVVSRTDGEGRAVVEIHDTGTGIPPEARSRIFDPFFTTKPVGVGTGLGLSICHGIITRLGGELQLESEVGKGSCFRVVLPPTASEAAPLERQATPRAGRRARILVVDDEPMVCAIVRRALSREHEVSAVTSAQEALERILLGEGFDLILCDLLMPGMTGMDLHAELSARAPEQARRMIFLTGGAFTGRAQEFLDAPGRTVLEKPFDLDRLQALVRGRIDPEG